ncbi:hypothetical protein DERF_005043 [Dermatophagoides farinae]|uniref:Uncharacterized protein n=1 Tax=Dermatophagoides farinae TaxID=6954 RepID=A0A922L664_DERFA|nr:hypothetical protein DERF_005043 [Dermatophagoides farinae]
MYVQVIYFGPSACDTHAGNGPGRFGQRYPCEAALLVECPDGFCNQFSAAGIRCLAISISIG